MRFQNLFLGFFIEICKVASVSVTLLDDYEWTTLCLDSATDLSLDAEFEETAVVIYDGQLMRAELVPESVGRHQAVEYEISKNYVAISEEQFNEDLCPAGVNLQLTQQILTDVSTQFGETKKVVLARRKEDDYIRVKVCYRKSVSLDAELLAAAKSVRSGYASQLFRNEREALRANMPGPVRGYVASEAPTLTALHERAVAAKRLVGNQGTPSAVPGQAAIMDGIVADPEGDMAVGNLAMQAPALSPPSLLNAALLSAPSDAIGVHTPPIRTRISRTDEGFKRASQVMARFNIAVAFVFR